MSYLDKAFHIIYGLALSCVCLPMRDCAGMENIQLRDEKETFAVATQKHFPVATAETLQFSGIVDTSEARSFLIFEIIFISLIIFIVVIGAYFCCKRWKLYKVFFRKTASRRGSVSSVRNLRPPVISLPYARIHPRTSTNTIPTRDFPEDNTNDSNTDTAAVKPPDYSSVVLSDTTGISRFPAINSQLSTDVPPPSYGEIKMSN